MISRWPRAIVWTFNCLRKLPSKFDMPLSSKQRPREPELMKALYASRGRSLGSGTVAVVVGPRRSRAECGTSDCIELPRDTIYSTHFYYQLCSTREHLRSTRHHTHQPPPRPAIDVRQVPTPQRSCIDKRSQQPVGAAPRHLLFCKRCGSPPRRFHSMLMRPNMSGTAKAVTGEHAVRRRL